MSKKLRLLVTSQCNRACPQCCNRNYDLDSLPVCYDYSPYEEIILTGGEPRLLKHAVLLQLIKDIRKSSNAHIYLQTAHLSGQRTFRMLLKELDGVTITFHDEDDKILSDFVDVLYALNYFYIDGYFDNSNLRLNLFKPWTLEKIKEKCPYDIHYILNYFKIKYMDWLDDCPVPTGEVFMQTEERCLIDG